jgi:predicted nucleotidyltransferase
MLQERCLGSVKVTSIDYEFLMATLTKIAGHIRNRRSEVRRILFYGSFVRGDYTPESDLDLIITVGETEIPFLFRPERFAEFFQAIPLDVNILVYTDGEIAKMIENGNEFIIAAMKEARKL